MTDEIETVITCHYHRAFGRIVRYRLESGLGTVLDRRATGARSPRCVGHFGELSGIPVALYRHHGASWLQVARRRIRVVPCLEPHWRRVDDHGPNTPRRRLRIDANGVELFDLCYEIEPWWYEFDFTPHVEEEDFDYGLFVADMLRSPSRWAPLGD
ncbi:hypothetical protein [Embleya scabrispora]|uniref:hypothetical protein n=1 Tax=Embleya scabrispora TaxID=159449 RepID=UPI0003752983|nr:hypothetical protein [Embleya scabrispora]MYS82853.1 hypothetical protein [Streptomyces sp. SID5474]MYS82860.1 hypothetical protein [Streptomyces sp. SID5474]